MSIAVSATTVGPGDVVTVSGTVTDDAGASVAGRVVRLDYRPSGGAWTRLATQRSADDGTVTFTSPAITESVATRLAVRKRAVSDKVRVDVQPSITLTAAEGSVDVVTTGGQRGDTVVLVKVTAHGVQEVGRQDLSRSGTTSFAVEPGAKRSVYVARLLRTPRHLAADDQVAVPRAPKDPKTSVDPVDPVDQRVSTGAPTSPT